MLYPALSRVPLWRPSSTAPRGVPRLDPNDSINDARFTCYVPGCGWLGDVCGQGSPLPFAGNALAASVSGLGLKVTSSASGAVSVTATPAQKVTGLVSVLWAGIFTSSTVNNYPALFGCEYDNTGLNPYTCWYVGLNNTSLQVQITYNNGTGTQQQASYSTLSTGVFYVIGATINANTGTLQFYLNGVLNTTTTGLSTGTIGYTATSEIALGSGRQYQGNETYNNAINVIGSAWNRLLLPSEWARLNSDIYAGLISSGDHIWYAERQAIYGFDGRSPDQYRRRTGDLSVFSDFGAIAVSPPPPATFYYSPDVSFHTGRRSIAGSQTIFDLPFAQASLSFSPDFVDTSKIASRHRPGDLQAESLFTFPTVVVDVPPEVQRPFRNQSEDDRSRVDLPVMQATPSIDGWTQQTHSPRHLTEAQRAEFAVTQTPPIADALSETLRIPLRRFVDPNVAGRSDPPPSPPAVTYYSPDVPLPAQPRRGNRAWDFELPGRIDPPPVTAQVVDFVGELPPAAFLRSRPQPPPSNFEALVRASLPHVSGVDHQPRRVHERAPDIFGTERPVAAFAPEAGSVAPQQRRMPRLIADVPPAGFLSGAAFVWSGSAQEFEARFRRIVPEALQTAFPVPPPPPPGPTPPFSFFEPEAAGRRRIAPSMLMFDQFSATVVRIASIRLVNDRIIVAGIVNDNMTFADIINDSIEC